MRANFWGKPPSDVDLGEVRREEEGAASGDEVTSQGRRTGGREGQQTGEAKRILFA